MCIDRSCQKTVSSTAAACKNLLIYNTGFNQ